MTTKPSPGLYIVSTPIGNLGDITFRASELLKLADRVLCEDSRQTSKLLKFIGSNAKTIIYNDHSGQEKREYIINLIEQGQIIALVSDAGTPLISDPGFKLISALKEKDIFYTAIPGPCAAINALVLSSLPTDQFYFGGFFPQKNSERKNLLEKIANLEASIIFYESPNRIRQSYDFIRAELEHRDIAVIREMTKIFEEVLINPKAEDIKEKGEFVMVISKLKVKTLPSDEEIIAIAESLSDLKTKQKAAFLAEKYRMSKKYIYDLLK